ncbi:MAG: hypothetical protein R8G66_27070 [Cytophagales bacterium]|nr:hypothetical protein [Cytophagales bacterium]
MGVDSQQVTLCLSCGLCCNGAIFSVISREAESFEITADELIHNDAQAFRLPCVHHIGNKCSIYNTPDKPHVCTKFKCRLVTQLDAGLTSLEECLIHVKEAQSCVEEIKVMLKDQGKFDKKISLELNVNVLHQRSLKLNSNGQATLPLLKHIALKLYFRRYFGVFEKQRKTVSWTRDLWLSLKLKYYQTLISFIQKPA